MEYDNDIRAYLTILEYYSSDQMLVETVDIPEEEPELDYRQRLDDIIFKLRSHTDVTGGEYSLGFEQGLEMAAQMIENVLKSGDRSES